MKTVAITPKPTEVQLTLTLGELKHIMAACSVAHYNNLKRDYGIEPMQHEGMIGMLESARDLLA